MRHKACITSCGDDEMEDFVESIELIGTWKTTEFKSSPSLPKDAKFELNNEVTFNADHSMILENGETAKWSLKNKNKNKNVTIEYSNQGVLVHLTLNILSYFHGEIIAFSPIMSTFANYL